MKKIVLNSDEFKCWHEVGHAVVCLHLRGFVELIEFLPKGDPRGDMRARCEPLDDEGHRSVLCGGFAAEYYLFNKGYVDGVNVNDPNDVARVSAEVFRNAWKDNQEFIGRIVTEDNDFTKAEKEAFMHHALESVVPIIHAYFPKMQNVVAELLFARRMDGVRVKELLQPPRSPA